MKKSFIFLFSLGIMLVSCNTVQKKKYQISGHIQNLEDGTVVYLKNLDEKNKAVTKDSTTVKSESFTFEGHVPETGIYFITIEKIPANIQVFLENTNIKLEAHKDSLWNAKILGGINNLKVAELRKEMKRIEDKMRTIGEDFMKASEEKNVATQTALKDEIQELEEEAKAYQLQFIKDNPNTLLAALLIDQIAKFNDIPIDTAMVLFDNLEEEVKKISQVKKIQTRLQELEEKIKKTAIGVKAPDFSGPNPEGKTLVLKELMGKVTLVDFWASWCKPCRKENPNLVKLYNKYHDKGLNIIGVSLDNSKESWIKAIKEDGLKWNHISNLAYFGEQIAKDYNVNAIPAAFLLDAEGKIVGKNLIGKELESKIKAMLP